MTTRQAGHTIEVMSPTDPKCILVVDDDDTIRALVGDILTLRGSFQASDPLGGG